MQNLIISFRQIHTIIVFIFIGATFISAQSQTKTTKFVKLTPLRYPGFYSVKNKKFHAYYFGQNRLEIIENDKNDKEYDIRICDVMPLPFALARDEKLSNYQFGFRSGSEIVNRDKGIV